MNPLRSLHFRTAIAIAATLFFVSALVTGVLVYQRQQALEHKLRENLIWAVYQFDREVRELRMVVAEEQKTPTPPALMDDSELLLRLDILYSRVQLLQSGQLGSMLAGMPDLHSQLMAMLPRIEVLDSAIMDLASRQARDASLYVQILSRLASLQEQTGELLLNINSEAAIQRTKERSELLNLYALALSLVLLMTLSGIVLVVALIVESRGRASKTRKLEERTQELDGMVQLAQAASRAKSEFMAIMSHEIRTPLNGMVGVSDLIGEEVSTRRGQQYLAMLRQSAESLQAVINDVLDYSKIEAGKLELDQRCFSLPEFLDSLAAHYHRQTGNAGKGCSRIFLEERGDDLPIWVKGDVNRLRQVLTNLLNNAFKFCPQGTIRLRASLEDGETLHFEVHDSGCGIAADQVSQLFAPFTQVDTSIARRHEGTGLGLAICKRLVEAMGGEIGVESHLGLGSRFWCRVPLPVLTAAEACPQQAVGDAPLPHASVLVVEDNEVNQSLARAMLEYLGQQVTVVEDGEQALEWLAQAGNDVDLVFMDMQMPVLDGVETTRRWRHHEAEQPASARLPIIAMTANVMQEDARRCIDAGMQGVLHKPFTRDDLHRVLQQYLVQSSDSQEKVLAPDKPEASAGERTTAVQAPGDDGVSSSAAEDQDAQIDAAPALDVATDDSVARALSDAAPSLLQHATCQELLATLSGEAYSRLLSNYLTRLEGRLDLMVTLLKQRDLTELKREAHSLKGASASLGCSGIAGGAKALEEAVSSDDMPRVHQHVATLRSLCIPTRDSLLAEGYLFS
ncbi:MULTISPECIES: ATP-binding protein [Cobetia]|uniref:ATP-binding protein n=1 Tax=Cobetia TaxID=204286 RepID=UPI001582088C|nr:MULTISPECIES: ATP-binding protein [Cobetia]MDI4659496.1 ATP-binding protein [Cobetia sp. BMC6]NUJ56044.1 response regulator [Cobetia marina]